MTSDITVVRSFLYYLKNISLIIICLRDVFKGNSSVNYRKVQVSVNYIVIKSKNVWMVVTSHINTFV